MSKTDNTTVTSIEDLHDLYHEKLMRYCSAMLNYNRDEALDCVQNTFLAAVASITVLETHVNPAGWLYKTAYNFVKRAQKQVAINLKYSVPLDEGIDCGITLDFEDRTELSDAKVDEYIELILSQLTEAETALYQLYYKARLSSKEIAGKMSISDSACRVRLFRLRKRIVDLVQAIGLE